MEVWHKAPAAGNPFYHFRCQQIGLYRRDPITVDAIYLVEGLHQVKEIFIPYRRGGGIGPFSKVSQIDAGQHNFPYIASFSQSLHGLHGPGNGIASADAPGHGDGTEGTVVVTAVLYF